MPFPLAAPLPGPFDLKLLVIYPPPLIPKLLIPLTAPHPPPLIPTHWVFLTKPLSPLVVFVLDYLIN